MSLKFPESAFRTLMLDLALLGHISDRDMLIKSIGRMIRELERAREQLTKPAESATTKSTSMSDD